MFNFLDFFGSSGGAGVFAVGSSLVNSYAQLRANKERNRQALYEQQHALRANQEHYRFDARQLKEREAEYSEICNYHVDMLRQNQLSNRQQLGFNILKSGIGITATDSAGLLLRHQAYMDEMKARSVEAEYYSNRPRSNINPAMLGLNNEAINRNIAGIKSAAPWQQLGSIVGGIRDLASIAKVGE
ncbi:MULTISPECIES: hypothetical protein [unclassified Rickettsia]|uniref:hypothetical protein n=1 Tax=unclassified Rickettsia TaxID=114295 RepID=UPI00209EA1F0|nr:hypothetical protein [Rickettsia endosymbiont of Ceutorhynchus assimilis]